MDDAEDVPRPANVPLIAKLFLVLLGVLFGFYGSAMLNVYPNFVVSADCH